MDGGWRRKSLVRGNTLISQRALTQGTLAPRGEGGDKGLSLPTPVRPSLAIHYDSTAPRSQTITSDTSLFSVHAPLLRNVNRLRSVLAISSPIFSSPPTIVLSACEGELGTFTLTD